MMNILIVDDEQLARARIRALLDDAQAAYNIEESSNGLDAINKISQFKADVVLMDIRMPGMDGLEAAQHMSQLDTPPAIIFTTAYDRYALEAFKTHAIDYLLKPIKADDLKRALQAVTRLTRPQQQSLTQLQNEEPTHISARLHGNIHLVAVNRIKLFYAEHKYVSVFYDNKEVLIEEPLVSLEERFTERFLRVHRNALVAKEAISGLEKDSQGQCYIKLTGLDKKIEVSRRHLPAVRKFLKEQSS